LDDRKLGNSVVSKVITDPDFKCRILIEFGMLREAAVIAREKSLTPIVAFIANLAWRSQLGALMPDLVKHLEVAAKLGTS
jgi:hypothetical protein